LLVDGELEETFYEHADSIVPANDINNPFDCEKFVWELFDTSCITDTPHEITEVSVNPCEGQSELEIKIWEKGTLGYYEETCQKYPDTKDCDGNYIYPHKVVDGVVIMDNVRHHKIPSRRTVSHFLSENNQEVEHSTNQDQPSVTFQYSANVLLESPCNPPFAQTIELFIIPPIWTNIPPFKTEIPKLRRETLP
jgi:hypothetical protein